MNTHIRKINRIFNEVNSINESLSKEDHKEFKRGFEFGLKMESRKFSRIMNEGFLDRFKDEEAKGKETVSDVKAGAKKLGSDIKSGVKKFGAGVKSMFSRGKEKAKEVFNSVKDFANSVISKVKDGIRSAADFVSSNYKAFVDKMNSVYESVANQLSEAWKELKDKASELKSAIVETISGIYNSIKEGVKSSISKIIESKDAFIKWFNENKEALKAKLIELKNSTIENSVKIANILLGAIVMAPERLYQALQKAGKAIEFMLLVVIGGVQMAFEKSVLAVKELANDIKEAISKKISDIRESVGDALINLGEKVKGEGDQPGNDKYQELLSKWKAQQKDAGKNTNPGQGTRAKLKKQADAMSEGRIVSFNDFLIY